MYICCLLPRQEPWCFILFFCLAICNIVCCICHHVATVIYSFLRMESLTCFRASVPRFWPLRLIWRFRMRLGAHQSLHYFSHRTHQKKKNSSSSPGAGAIWAICRSEPNVDLLWTLIEDIGWSCSKKRSTRRSAFLNHFQTKQWASCLATMLGPHFIMHDVGEGFFWQNVLSSDLDTPRTSLTWVDLACW